MAELPSGCRSIDADLSALIDEELAPRREAELRAHLEGCARCTRSLEELCNADLALASLRAPEPSADLRARLERRLAEAARPRSGAPPPRPRRWLARPALAAAAAALVLMLYATLRSGAPPGPVAEPAPRVAVAEPALANLSDEELALLLDLDAVADLDVIANLDLVESFLDLEGREGAG
jgi:anti-sigma factor RsiW